VALLGGEKGGGQASAMNRDTCPRLVLCGPEGACPRGLPCR
jgi:hypothetical protein